MMACPTCFFEILKKWHSKCPQCLRPEPKFMAGLNTDDDQRLTSKEKLSIKKKIQDMINSKWTEARLNHDREFQPGRDSLGAQLWRTNLESGPGLRDQEIRNFMDYLRETVNLSIEDAWRVSMTLSELTVAGISGALWGFLLIVPTLGVSVPIGFWVGVFRQYRRIHAQAAVDAAEAAETPAPPPEVPEPVDEEQSLAFERFTTAFRPRQDDNPPTQAQQRMERLQRVVYDSMQEQLAAGNLTYMDTVMAYTATSRMMQYPADARERALYDSLAARLAVGGMTAAAAVRAVAEEQAARVTRQPGNDSLFPEVFR